MFYLAEPKIKPMDADFNIAHPMARYLVAPWLLWQRVGKIKDERYAQHLPNTVNDLSGGATWSTGPMGACLAFDGTGYVNCGHRGYLELSGGFTISAWVNLSSVTSSSTVRRFFSRSEGGGGWGVGVNGANPRFTSYARVDYDFTAVTLATDTWYRLTFVHRAATNSVELYVNGRWRQTLTGGNSIADSGGSYWDIGAGVNHVEKWLGRIADVFVWNAELPAGSIAEHNDNPYEMFQLPFIVPGAEVVIPRRRVWMVM